MLVADPELFAGYDRMVMALAATHPDATIRAARQACIAAPADRRLWKNLGFLLARSGRWSEVDAATPRQRLPLPTPARHPVDLGAAVDRFTWLMEQLRERADEAWTPSSIEHWKQLAVLDSERLANFRRSEVSGGTQNTPDRPQGFPELDFGRLYPWVSAKEREKWVPQLQLRYFTMLHRLYQRDASGIDWYDAAAADDDRFGGRVMEIPGVGPVTSKSIQAAYYACRMMHLVPENGVVLEIGGGFGAVASRLLAIRPDVTYVLTDLPVNLMLSHTYLASYYGDAVAGLWNDSDRPGPGHRALVVPPWRLASLPVEVDLTVNTMSFQHMDARNHAFYGNAMRALGTRRLYHLNRTVHRGDPAHDTMAVPADRYGFLADFRIVEQRDFDGQWIEVIAESRG